ncbi:MAG: LEA type 2 family protein [Methanoregula sp.]|jgi:LEA14-like dessication related protein|uniref:LEA type 2 family protein n=1 Tax=Methanoregula sp. TaxID=2052170 RepID=UPI003D1518F7
MPVLREPVVTLGDVSVRSVSLSSLDLDVAIRVQNPNLFGVTLRELPFTVTFRTEGSDRQIAAGNTGRVKIPARTSTVLRVPVTSHNSALIGALVAFVATGGIEVTIQGTAVINLLVTGWSVPFRKTVPVTVAQVARTIAGQKK